MKNPLNRRFLRELKADMGKYIALFLFLTATIGFCSGFLVADGSMKRAYDGSFEKYEVEDGHFSFAAEASEEFLDKLSREQSIDVEELFYKDEEMENEHTIRIFKNRQEMNRADVLEGHLPSEEKEIMEIAIDRLYAENNGISIGDSITVDGTEFQICGLVALSDYSTLFKNNTDMMFDASKFTVALVSDTAFDAVSENGLKYCYGWRNHDQNLTESQKQEQSDAVKNALMESGMLTDFVSREDNQAIMFTGDDMGSDKAMITWMLYIVMVVLAFVFAVTTRNTMEQEASVIGTLRASGYSRGELIRHYLILPLTVTLIAAVIGNVLGYSWMKQIVVGMYYHSYSLPGYRTVWNAEAFLLTTVVPCIIIFVVNLLVLTKTLSLPPLRFLQHDLKKKRRKRVMKLPRWKFFTRFRIRIIFQNLAAYATMLVGIMLASLLLMFGMLMTPLLDNFKAEVIESQIADYQYILKAPVETEEKNAEKYSVASLVTEDEKETITVYGIENDSRYLEDLELPEGKGQVIASEGYLEKFGLRVGDSVTLEEKYNNKSYTFTIAGSYHYAAALSIFMPKEIFNETFGCDGEYFSGYFTDKKLDDIHKAYVASIVTQHDLTIIADQLDDSMGRIFPMFGGFAVLLYMLMIYLLAKLIVEKNAQSISMLKILGYTGREAGSLYNRTTAVVVGVSLVVSLPLSYLAMRMIYYVMMQELSGWMTFYIAPWIYPAMLVIGVICYFIIHCIEMKKIHRIPMGQALKNIE